MDSIEHLVLEAIALTTEPQQMPLDSFTLIE